MKVPTTPKNFSIMENFNMLRGQHTLFSTSKIFQPPPFIIGGFVGSKIYEQKSVSFNCGDLLAQIFQFATSFEPMVMPHKMYREPTAKINTTKMPVPVVSGNTESSTKKIVTNIPPTQRSLIEPSPKPVMPSNIPEVNLKPVYSGSVDSGSDHSKQFHSGGSTSENRSDSCVEPLPCDITKPSGVLSRERSLSESSEESWASDDDSPIEQLEPQKSGNPWISQFFVPLSDDDTSDDENPCEPPCEVSKSNRSLSRGRSIAESSEESWASDSPAKQPETQKNGNPWISQIFASSSDEESEDGESDDEDSDWDCVDDDDDFQSENGEIINEFKWNNYDSLSPIMSPVTRTPPALTPALEDYDSDESEGILIVCGVDLLEVDDEEEARERESARKRMEEVNRRWLENLEQSVDVPDGKERKTQNRRVRFPAGGKMIQVHSIIAWSFAYRAARKGDWECHARDRARFRERIETIASILEPVLQPSHREKIHLRNQTLEFPADAA